MNELPFYSDPLLLINSIKNLHATRIRNKVTSRRQVRTRKERLKVLEKTDGRCHVFGAKIVGTFQADHVKCHSSGGDHNVANYLPSCNLCNNYRWDYSSEEIQWILKIGVWAKTEMQKNSGIGKEIAKLFIKHEIRRETRRRRPRQTS